jgi:WD repeat and SOF domain-containing protein 1
MVKIKTISRSEKSYLPETKLDLNKIQKNTSPSLHPLLKPREYQRALIATKIDKIFAQPFLGNLAGHTDGVSVMAKSWNSVTNFLSGSYDGQIMYGNYH